MSIEDPLNRSKAQAGNVSFELHSLGWEAFQNLCGHIAREVLGQTVTAFSPTKDAGQDGAFQGIWKKEKQEILSGRFVIQCKFTARRDEHLSLSDLEDEIVKAKRLASQGLVQTYLLMTNAKVTGEADNLIRQEFGKIKVIEHFDIFGSEWITQQILDSKHLRALVPRVYGLGDLSQILDERVYRQTSEILETWRDNLAKFVPTEAHCKSVKALLKEGFVLLLGDPMAGKSTIAASLAIAAADQWECTPVFASDPDDFKRHWNPDEPNQFFWVDDAFGQTQLRPSLAEAWNRLFPHVTAALRKGTKVLFTSRTYVYVAAKRELKLAAFPLLENSHVIIEVEKLKLEEKQRILYNHIRLGNQPAEFRKQIKPCLSSIASSPKFFPEIARRLGNAFFTGSLNISKEQLMRFVEEPKQFLSDIIQQLHRNNFAALALLFMRGGRAQMPLCIDEAETEALTQLGAGLAQITEALFELQGSLVIQTLEGGERYWRFRHPSIRDAIATYVAGRSDLIDIYLGGVRPIELLQEVVCGDMDISGAKVHVPGNRFSLVISKLEGINLEEWQTRYSLLSFLDNRCSSDFLSRWVAACPKNIERLARIGRVENDNYRSILARLHKLRVLPEEERAAFVREATKKVIDYANPILLYDDSRSLVTKIEMESAYQRIREELIPNLEEMIDEMEGEYPEFAEEPKDYFDEFSTNLGYLCDFFAKADLFELSAPFERSLQLIDDAIFRIDERKGEHEKAKQREKELEAERRARDDEWYFYHAGQFERGGKTLDAPIANETSNPRFISENQRSIFDDIDS